VYHFDAGTTRTRHRASSSPCPEPGLPAAGDPVLADRADRAGLHGCRRRPEAAEESAVKAAFIYNFAKFVDWPEDAWNRSPRLRLCVSGGGDLAQALAALESKPPVRGKPVEVRQQARGDDGSGCHILVVTGRSQRPAGAVALPRCSRSATATASPAAAA
jgi:hypothetical protein